MSLVARHLEENGIPTVVLGSARDIVEQSGVPRFLFSDFPLGNPCGRPYEREMQRSVVEQALALFESVVFPRTTVQSPLIWSDDSSWKDRYLQIDAAQAAELRAEGERRREKQAQARQDGSARSS